MRAVNIIKRKDYVDIVEQTTLSYFILKIKIYKNLAGN